MIWRHCEGSGRSVVDGHSWCSGCGMPVRRAVNVNHVDPLVTPRVLRCAWVSTDRPAVVPTHDRVDLVAMIRAGAFGPFDGVEQLVLEVAG